MGNSDARLLLIGLDNSGKTTILSRIIDPSEKATNITPTIGYRKDKFTRNGIDFQILDMSGQSKYRDLWQSNATQISQKDEIHGIIFVVDSTDRMRLKVAKSELEMIVENKSIPQTIPYLFYANKSDIKGCCSFEEIVETLELKTLNRHYHITCCSGINGQGVEEGIEWLAGIIKLKLDKAR